MFLSITSRGRPADDLGYVLAKHPQKVHRFDLGWGEATVFFPRAGVEECTAALYVDVDTLGLSRSKRFKASGFDLADHINDRSYAASSLLAVALGRVFRSALAGACKERPELVGQKVPLTIRVPALPARHVGWHEDASERDPSSAMSLHIDDDREEESACPPETGEGVDARSGKHHPQPCTDSKRLSPEALMHAIFAPLGWRVDAHPVPLSSDPAWGDSRYVDLTLSGEQTAQAALQHLYILLPVLDDSKHYWVGETETDKLLRHAGDWLATHPMREWIMGRYLAHQKTYVADATQRLLGADDSLPEEQEHSCQPPSLAVERRLAIADELAAHQAWRVIDMGCGEGKLIRDLLSDPRFTQVVGADVSPTVLSRAERSLGIDRMSDRMRERIQLIQSSVTYRDSRLRGHDAIVLTEVIEHIDPDRLPALEEVVFGFAEPSLVIVTTPNKEYNDLYGLSDIQIRHADHRFEWERPGFQLWAESVAQRNGYEVTYRDVGPVDRDRGAPTQMAVFSKRLRR